MSEPGAGAPRPASERLAPPQTGDAAVDSALVELSAASGAPVAEQVEAYVGTHRSLQDRLADLDG